MSKNDRRASPHLWGCKGRDFQTGSGQLGEDQEKKEKELAESYQILKDIPPVLPALMRSIQEYRRKLSTGEEF